MRLPAGLRETVNGLRRRLKAPRMLHGYRDASGAWRPDTRVSDTAFIYRPERISVGDHAYVGHYVVLDGTGGIEIGEGTQISSWAGIFTHSSHIAVRLYGKHYLEVHEDERKGYRKAPVRVGRYVFIGVGAKIFSGVTIGDGALIAAGSIVKSDVGAFEIVAGDPAAAVGDARELDARYLEDPRLREWYEEWQRK